MTSTAAEWRDHVPKPQHKPYKRKISEARASPTPVETLAPSRARMAKESPVQTQRLQQARERRMTRLREAICRAIDAAEVLWLIVPAVYLIIAIYLAHR